MEYKIGDTVLIRAKVEDVDFDEDGQTCIVSLPWAELKAMDPEELVAEKAAEALAKTEKALAKTGKASEKPEKPSKNGANRNRTAEKEPKRQQETTKAAGHKEAHIPLPPGGHKLAKELAELNKRNSRRRKEYGQD